MAGKQVLGGRPKTSGVWEHFKYDIEKNVSECMIDVAGKPCGKQIGGRNPTNLKSHMQSFHKSEFKTLKENEEAIKKGLSSKTQHDSGSKPHDTGSRKITNFLTTGANSKYGFHSEQHKARVRNLALAVAETGIPASTLPESRRFRDFCKLMDPKFELPGKGTFVRELENIHKSLKETISLYIKQMRRYSLCLDLWTKKGMTSSFLGISICGYVPERQTVDHMMLNLHKVEHPHTGEMIAETVNTTMQTWGILPSRILTVITDNGSNMVKAFKQYFQEVQEAAQIHEDNSDDEDSGADEDPVDVNTSKLKLTRLPCFVHTIQLVVLSCTRSEAVSPLLSSARRIVQKIRSSSVAQQKLIAKANKTVILDCPTRWSSTYLMVNRLMELKNSVSVVVDEMGWDGLMTSEWIRLEHVLLLLKPFADHTNLLERDAVVLSSVIPALMDLDCHLLQFQNQTAVDNNMREHAVTLLSSLRLRFKKFMDPYSEEWQPLPAVACLLDPVLAPALMSTHNKSLLDAAKHHLLQMLHSNSQGQAASDSVSAGACVTSERDPTAPPKLKRFKFLSQTIDMSPATTSRPSGAEAELDEYISSMPYDTDDALAWWHGQATKFHNLCPLAIDILSVPASEAYVERMFSISGELSSGKRNRALKTLEAKTFLKLNLKFM